MESSEGRGSKSGDLNVGVVDGAREMKYHFIGTMYKKLNKEMEESKSALIVR